MPDPSRSLEDFLAELDKEVAGLAPGEDLGAFITAKADAMRALLASRIAASHDAAATAADSPPSGMPALQQPAPRPGRREAPKDVPPS